MIVLDEFPDQVAQMALTENDELVQTLVLYGLHKSLGVRIAIGAQCGLRPLTIDEVLHGGQAGRQPVLAFLAGLAMTPATAPRSSQVEFLQQSRGGCTCVRRTPECSGSQLSGACRALHSVQEAPLVVGRSFQLKSVAVIDAMVAFAGLTLQLECTVKECIDFSPITSHRDPLVFDVVTKRLHATEATGQDPP